MSVIVPSFRHERYVEQALDSCLASGYPNLQLVIANDASPENDDEKIRAWLDRNPEARAVYVNHTRNQGLTRTFNECIALCEGEYITLLAGDDVLLPDALEKRVEYLETHSDKLAVFTDCAVIDQDGTVLFESGIEGLYRHMQMSRRALCDDRLLPIEIAFHWAVPGPVFTARREAYEVVGNYDESLTMEDWDMYLRLAAIGRLGFLNESTALYRWHSTQVVKTVDPARAAEVRGVATRAARRFRGIVRLYLRAYGEIKPLAPNAPFPERARMKAVRYFVQYSGRAYRIYRERMLSSNQA